MRVATLTFILLFPALVFGQKQGKVSFRRLANEKNVEVANQLIAQLIARGEQNNKTDEIILANLFLGELMQRTGDFTRAEDALTRAYELYQQNVEKRRHDYLASRRLPYTWFDAIDRLAYFYLYTGNVKKAEALFNESQTKRNSTFKKLSVHRIHPVIGLGSVYLRQGKTQEAFKQFAQARDMISRATTTGFDFDVLNRTFYNDMIEASFHQGQYEEARRYIKSLALSTSGTRKFSSDLISKMETARVFEMYARLSLAEGNLMKAQEYLDKANKYYPATLGTSDVKFKIIKTQANLYWTKKDFAQADAAFIDLVRQYRQHISKNFVAMSEYEKEQFYYTLKKDFDLFNSYVAASFSRSPSNLFAEMYDNIVNTKALLLNATNQKKNKILSSGDRELINKFHEWEKKRAILSSLYFENGNEAAIASTTRELEDLEKALNHSSGLFDNADNPPGWKKIQEKLKAKEVAIEMARVALSGTKRDSSVYIMLVLKPGAESPSGFIIPAGYPMEKRGLGFYSNSIRAKDQDERSYKTFWAPIKENLPVVSRLYFSPDGVYNQLNLNTLYNTSTDQYLIDEIELVYLTNTADLLSEQQQVAVRDAVLVGRPQFDESVALADVLPYPDSINYFQRNILSEELISFKENDFTDLPGTETEINKITETLTSQGISTRTYIGNEANETTVKSVKSPSILHIATHGFFVDDAASSVSPMIRSGLVLAGVKNKNHSSEDGILTAYEATNLDLENTSLVVLSACETGLGEVRNGEGVYGLQRAIIVAGADNLLMSFWKVDDAVTAELMASLYRARLQSGNLAAFRSTQVELRKKYPQPYFWGAFVILGK